MFLSLFHFQILTILILITNSITGNNESVIEALNVSDYGTFLPNGEVRQFTDPDAEDEDESLLPENRVVGGRKATLLDAPYQVGIFRKDAGITCGGALYNRNTVITAAHCFGHPAVKVEDFVFVFGKTDLQRPESTEVITTASMVCLHPKYNNTLYTYDIAVVKLKQSICCNEYVRPIMLPAPDTPLTPIIQVSGWGYTKQRKRSTTKTSFSFFTSKVLKVTEIEFVSKNECQKQLYMQNIYPYIEIFQNPTIFCAGVRNGSQDACQGDSGGPAVCMRADGEKYLCGLISSGWGCGLENTPAIYTDMSKFVDWVNQDDTTSCKYAASTTTSFLVFPQLIVAGVLMYLKQIEFESY